jgi:hypothetical protein
VEEGVGAMSMSRPRPHNGVNKKRGCENTSSQTLQKGLETMQKCLHTNSERFAARKTEKKVLGGWWGRVVERLKNSWKEAVC